MNIQWTNMTGFGPVAWNHGGQPLEIPSMTLHHEQNTELVLHSHKDTSKHSLRAHNNSFNISHRASDNEDR
jgi:hypothetical protein